MTATFQTEQRSQSATEYASESAMASARLEALDRRLAQLGRGVGALRLRIGEALEAFAHQGGPAVFGFSSLGAYAAERLGRTGHWAADARSLARRLAGLPGLRRALVAGELGTSMVELLARVAVPLSEAELSVLIGEARGATVRAMRARLAVGDADAHGEARPSRATIVATMTSVEALAFERARLLLEAVGETRSRDEVIEAMLAEGLGEILARWPGVAMPFGLGTETAARAAWRAEVARAAEEAEAAAEQAAEATHGGTRWGAPVGFEAEAEAALPDEAFGLDKCLREMAAELATRDLVLAELGSQMCGCRGYLALGYASFAQYARERIGISPSAMKARVTLAERMRGLPELREAVSAGRLGFETAGMVARVAGPEHVDAWIARAEARTVKHLREEVEAARMLARVAGARVVEGPPDEDLVQELREVERSALAGASEVGGLMSGGAVAGGDGVGGQMSGGPAAGRVPLKMSLRDDLARFWRCLEGIHRTADPETSFVWFLCASVERAWRGVHGGQVAYQDVYLRDGFRCANPMCERRDVTPHHIRFRSHGGGEERANLVSLCTVCHLELVHGGRIKVTGRAPDDLTWSFGDSGLVVRGRECGA